MRAKSKVKKFGRNEYGISNLIATLVLIVAAVVGGAFVFMTMRDQATTMASNPDASIQSINVTKAQDTVLATATVKNSGSKPLTDIKVTVNGYDGTNVTTAVIGSLAEADPDSPIPPGETYSFDNSNLGTANFTTGEEYTVHLHAVASDDSTIDKTLKVRVE